MKLELKHLAPYLPYKVRCEMLHFTKPNHSNYKSYGILIGIDWMGQWLMKNESTQNIDTCVWGETKPILRPLSDLDEEIEHNGEKFVPYDKLKTVVSSEQWVKICETINEPKYIKIFDMPHWWVNLLYAWHFDIFGLIEKGLAKDINTLEK